MNARSLLLLIILLPAFSFSAPDDISALLARANQLWLEQNFISYAKTCKKIDTIRKTFPSSYNIALGYYRGGDVENALDQIMSIRNGFELSDSEKALLAELEKDASDYQKEIVSIKKTHIKKGGGATLSKGNSLAEARESCGRHADCQRLKPDQIHDYMKEMNRRDSIAAGSMVPPDDGDSAIEPLTMQ